MVWGVGDLIGAVGGTSGTWLLQSVNHEIGQRRASVIVHCSLFICHWSGNGPMNIGH
jgi:hypothetical protein